MLPGERIMLHQEDAKPRIKRIAQPEFGSILFEWAIIADVLKRLCGFA
jgi:hypothetical protein